MDHLLGFLIQVFVFFSRFAKPLASLGLGCYEEWTPGKRRKVLIVGYNGARNTGADARVVSIVRQIKEVFGPDQVQITVMTLNQNTLAGYFDDDVILSQFSSIFPLDLYRACCSHHCAILSEGSTLKSTFADALTLFFCQAAGIMKMQGKPCVAYGSEVGDMAPYLKKISARLCDKTYFLTRTEGSQTALEALGLHGHVATDTAWLYDGAISSEEARQFLMQAGWDGRKKLVGIAAINPFCWPVRASLGRFVLDSLRKNFDSPSRYDKWYYFSESPQRKRALNYYLSSLASAFLHFQNQSRQKEHPEECFPVLLGMERLDAEAISILKEKLNQPCAIFLSEDTRASQMTGLLRQLSLLVTSRYHACVLSMEASIPVVAVSMDERLDHIFQELGFTEDCLHHTTDRNLAGNVYRSMRWADQNREEIRKHLTEAVIQYKETNRQMGEFLKAYLEKELLSLR